MQGMVPLSGFGGVPYSAVRKAAPRNILDNSDFTNLVAQAGIGGNHGTIAYAADRWILDSGTVSYEAGVGLTLNGTIRQKLEFPPTGETSAFVGMASGAASISYADGEVTITSGGGVIKWAALYGGVYTETTKPEYQPKGYGAELAECQRYFQVVKSAGSEYIAPVGFGYATSATSGRICIPIVAQMRDNVVPSIETNGGAISVKFGTGSATVSDITVIGSSVRVPTHSVIVSATTNGLTTNQLVILTITSTELQISADL